MTEQINTDWKNPFNLIEQDIANENAKVVENKTPTEDTTVQNESQTTNQTQTEQKWLFDRFVDFLSSLWKNNQTPNNNTTQTETQKTDTQNGNKKTDEPHDITKQIIKFIAKITGQPDPETWTQQSPTTQTTWNTETATTTETKKIDFDSVMSSVSWFMDKVWQTKVVSSVTWVLEKIEDKFEETTWINLDPTAKKEEKPVENNTQPTTTSVEETKTVSIETPTETKQPEEAQPITNTETPIA